jgi:hypothetical protein
LYVYSTLAGGTTEQAPVTGLQHAIGCGQGFGEHVDAPGEANVEPVGQSAAGGTMVHAPEVVSQHARGCGHGLGEHVETVGVAWLPGGHGSLLVVVRSEPSSQPSLVTESAVSRPRLPPELDS